MFQKVFHEYLSESSFTQVESSWRAMYEDKPWRSWKSQSKSHTLKPSQLAEVRIWLVYSWEQRFSALTLDLLNQNIWGWGPAICILTSFPGDSGACWNWRTTGIEDRCIYYYRFWRFCVQSCAGTILMNFESLSHSSRLPSSGLSLRFITLQELEMLGVYIPST